MLDDFVGRLYRTIPSKRSRRIDLWGDNERATFIGLDVVSAGGAGASKPIAKEGSIMLQYATVSSSPLDISRTAQKPTENEATSKCLTIFGRQLGNTHVRSR